MASAAADTALQRAVHSKWTHYVMQYVGPDKETVVGLLDIAKVEFKHSWLSLFTNSFPCIGLGYCRGFHETFEYNGTTP